jgi:hypothetical protein
MPTIEGAAYALAVAWYDNSFDHSTEKASRFIALIGTVNGKDKLPKNGKIKIPTLAARATLNDNGLVSQNVEEVAGHVAGGGTIHDQRSCQARAEYKRDRSPDRA